MLPFATDFIAPDGTLVTAFNSAFYSVQGNLVINSNIACGTSLPPVVDVVGVLGATSPNHFAEGVVGAIGGASYAGIALRCGLPGSGNGYWWLGTTGGSVFGYISAGVFTILLAVTEFFPGDLIRGEVDDVNFNLLINGVSVATPADGTFATGNGGASGFRNDLFSGMSSLKVGNLRPVPQLYMPAFVGGF